MDILYLCLNNENVPGKDRLLNRLNANQTIVKWQIQEK